jgi:hypothetical protein
MPSPFPGMDPYLEGPLWQSFQHQYIAEIARQLSPRLRPKYLAFVSDRIVMDFDDDKGESSLYPDGRIALVREAAATCTPGVPQEPPLRIPTRMPSPAKLFTVELRDVEERRLVTVIELLSPANKRGDGRKEYLDKRNKILVSDTHLLEIDLLRRGQRVPTQKLLPEQPYFVFLSRADRRPMMDVWPMSLKEEQSTVPVPLLPGDADIPLELQSAFSNVYDTLNYDLAIDYAVPPATPLDDQDQEWIRARTSAHDRNSNDRDDSNIRSTAGVE